MTTKEEVYDAEIHPLMAQIIEICQRHKIAMVAQFAIPTPADPDLVCTTTTNDETGAKPPGMGHAVRVLTRGIAQSVLAMTIVKTSGD